MLLPVPLVSQYSPVITDTATKDDRLIDIYLDSK